METKKSMEWRTVKCSKIVGALIRSVKVIKCNPKERTVQEQHYRSAKPIKTHGLEGSTVFTDTHEEKSDIERCLLCAQMI